MAQDPARVVIGFAAEGLGGKGFSPLNLPGTFDIDLHDVDPDLLERLQADFELDLCAGHYRSR